MNDQASGCQMKAVFGRGLVDVAAIEQPGARGHQRRAP